MAGDVVGGPEMTGTTDGTATWLELDIDELSCTTSPGITRRTHIDWRVWLSCNALASSASRMRFMNRNWSATKQRLHPQSVAQISRHSVLSGGQDSTM